jgi:penicillin amidase
MNRAASAAELIDAWRGTAGPAMNLVAADTGGHIVHQVVGSIPDRGRGAGRLPSPGSDPRWAWSGSLPIAVEPRLDPPENFVATANHDLFGEGDFPERDRVPGEFAPPWRVRRIRAALAARSDWTVDAFAELQGDVVSGRAIAVLHLLRPELEERDSPTARELMAWDGRMQRESSAATLFSAFMLALERAVGGDEASRDGLEWNPMGSERLLRLLAGGIDQSWWDDVGSDGQEVRGEILDRALEDLDRKGTNEQWGVVHKVHFNHPLGALPGVGKMVSDSWSRGPFAVAGDNVTVNAMYWSRREPYTVTSIPAMRFVTDVGNWDDTILVLPIGQSGRPWSRHYSDQISSWLDLEHVRFPFSRDAVDRAAEARLELVPAPVGKSR